MMSRDSFENYSFHRLESSFETKEASVRLDGILVQIFSQASVTPPPPDYPVDPTQSRPRINLLIRSREAVNVQRVLINQEPLTASSS